MRVGVILPACLLIPVSAGRGMLHGAEPIIGKPIWLLNIALLSFCEIAKL